MKTPKPTFLETSLNVLLITLVILAIFIVLYFIWGIIQSMRLTKYFKYIKLREKETAYNKTLSEIEVKIYNTKQDQATEEEKRNALLLQNYELAKEQLKLKRELEDKSKQLIVIDNDDTETEETVNTSDVETKKKKIKKKN